MSNHEEKKREEKHEDKENMIEALVYTQEHNSVSYKEMFVGHPYNMIINRFPTEKKNKLGINVFLCEHPRLVSLPSYNSIPCPVKNMKPTQVNEEWVKKCRKVLQLRETCRQTLQELQNQLPRDLNSN